MNIYCRRLSVNSDHAVINLSAPPRAIFASAKRSSGSRSDQRSCGSLSSAISRATSGGTWPASGAASRDPGFMIAISVPARVFTASHRKAARTSHSSGDATGKWQITRRSDRESAFHSFKWSFTPAKSSLRRTDSGMNSSVSYSSFSKSKRLNIGLPARRLRRSFSHCPDGEETLVHRTHVDVRRLALGGVLCGEVTHRGEIGGQISDARADLEYAFEWENRHARVRYGAIAICHPGYIVLPEFTGAIVEVLVHYGDLLGIQVHDMAAEQLAGNPVHPSAPLDDVHLAHFPALGTSAGAAVGRAGYFRHMSGGDGSKHGF